GINLIMGTSRLGDLIAWLCSTISRSLPCQLRSTSGFKSPALLARLDGEAVVLDDADCIQHLTHSASYLLERAVREPSRNRCPFQRAVRNPHGSSVTAAELLRHLLEGRVLEDNQISHPTYGGVDVRDLRGDGTDSAG